MARQAKARSPALITAGLGALFLRSGPWTRSRVRGLSVNCRCLRTALMLIAAVYLVRGCTRHPGSAAGRRSLYAPAQGEDDLHGRELDHLYRSRRLLRSRCGSSAEAVGAISDRAAESATDRAGARRSSYQLAVYSVTFGWPPIVKTSAYSRLLAHFKSATPIPKMPGRQEAAKWAVAIPVGGDVVARVSGREFMDVVFGLLLGRVGTAPTLRIQRLRQSAGSPTIREHAIRLLDRDPV